VHDPETKIITAYLEGVDDGARLLAVLEQARAARKPVVILKGGATDASARAAIAHTGALVGNDRVWDAVFREQAVIRVHSQEEMLDVAMFLSGIEMDRLPAGNGVAAMTFGGGTGVLSADQCVPQGLATPSLEPATKDRLKGLVPPIASIANPIDLTPVTYNQAHWLELFPQALNVIAADPGIHTLFFQCGGMAHKATEIMDNICGIRDRTQKPVCVFWALAPEAVRKRLPAEGIYVFPEVARGVRAIGHAVRFASALSQPPRPENIELPAFDWTAHVMKPEAGMVISEHQCHALLADAGLPVAAGQLVNDEDGVVRAAEAIGYPVALKGISPAAPHRAAAGLLELDVRSDMEGRDAYRRIAGRTEQAAIRLDGIYVQHMVKGGLELLVSAFRDPTFGVMVSCGAGGNLTEVIDDVTLERAPVDQEQAVRMLKRLRIVRRATKLQETAEVATAADFVTRFSCLVATAPWRRFVIEVNPIKWGTEGMAAVDGLIVIEEPR
jgi:acyl-CoA synthetase (NDP forming)